MKWQAWHCVAAVAALLTTPAVGAQLTTPAVGAQLTTPASGNGGKDLLPKSDECGRKPDTSVRIFYGDEADVFAYPWVVLLGYESWVDEEMMWDCGGAVISELYVITAAHCLISPDGREPDPGELKMVRLGEHNIATNIDCPPDSNDCPLPQDIPPDKWFTHPTYFKRSPVSDDLGLVRLSKKVKFGISVQPICLPPQNLDIKKFLGERDAVIAGWGTTETNRSAEVLQMAHVPYADKTECATHYKHNLTEEMVCFGGRGTVDSCFGDSGGPVFQTDLKTNHQYLMLAVVSFGLPVCGQFDKPAVYTNIGAYTDWIIGHLEP